MKKFCSTGILGLFLFSSLYSTACDICGCGTGASFMGMIPQLGRSQIAVRSHYRNFLHPDTPLNYNGKSKVLEDEMFTYEFVYRHFNTTRWGFFINIPYRMNVRHETARTTTLRGPGDISASVNYIAINTSDSMDHRLKHTLMLGAGIKIGNARYMQRDETKLMLPVRFQLGSGANDITAQLYYTLRYRQWGININGQYTYSGENELKYRFGQQYQSTGMLFYKKDFVQQKKKIKEGTQVFDPVNSRTWSILPSAGMNVEHSEQDKEYDLLKPYTGGSQAFFQAVLDIYVNKMAFSFYYQHAVYNHIPVTQPGGKSRMGVAFAFTIG